MAVELFRFRRWAVVTAGAFSGFFAIYFGVVFVLSNKRHAEWVSLWTLFFVALTWYLLIKVHGEIVRFETPRARPLGITMLCGLGIASFILFPTICLSSIRNHPPLWDTGSLIFDFGLGLVLMVGLWNLSEWARVLTEVLAFFSPLNLLPLILGVNIHRPTVVSIVVCSLIFTVWSIVYMRSPAVVEAFQSDRIECSRSPSCYPSFPVAIPKLSRHTSS